MEVITSLSGLKVVTLECPYDNWDNLELRSLFVKMIDLKLRGYRKEYPYGVLPIDTTDFIATHHLLCRQSNELEPVMGFKTINYSRCKLHRIAFPMLAILQAARLPGHERVVAEVLDGCDRNSGDAAYASSWTIDPEIRKDRDFVSLLRRILVTMLISHNQDYKISQKFICGSVRFKTDKMLQTLGYQPLHHDGMVLSAFQQAALMGDNAVAMHCATYADDALTAAKAYQALWRQRLVIGEAAGVPMQVAA